MTMKRAFENFIADLGIVSSSQLDDMAPAAFGARFFEFARKNGYDIANSPRLSLDRLDLRVEEIIDVGVNDGTPWLYDRYPDGRFILVEPQKNAEALLRHRPRDYTLLNLALGAAPATRFLTEDNERSSILGRAGESAQPEAKRKRYKVEVSTLDAVITSQCKTDAIGLKIDVEGFEHFVLEGLKSELGRIQFIILELSIRNRFKGERNFSDVTALLLKKGFRFYNIMNPTRPSPPNAHDAIFLPSNSPYFDV